MVARWLPELVSRLIAGPGMATAYARMAGQTKEGAPVLLAFTKPMPDDQARTLGRQQSANKVITGTVEDSGDLTIRMQILDVESENTRLLEDIGVNRERLETLPGRVTDALVGALEIEAPPGRPADLDFPNATALRSFFQCRDVVARMGIGSRPPADELDATLEPFFDLADAMPNSLQALQGFIETLGRFLDPRSPQLVEPAKPILERALERFPESPQLWHMQATVHASFSQPPASDEAEEALQKAMTLDRAYLPARFALADLYRFLGRDEEEEALYVEISDDPQLGASARERFGSTLANRGEMEQAEAQWRAALELDPGFTPALRNLAQFKLSQGNQAEADSFFEKAVARPEKLPAVLFEYSKVLIDRQEFARSIPYLQRHLRVMPNHVPSLVAIGNAQLGLGDKAAAMEAFKRAGEMDPRGIAGAEARHALFGLEKPEDAALIDDLTQKVWESDEAETLAAIREFLNDHEDLGLWAPWYSLGIGHRNLAQWEEAEEALQKALEQCPSQPDVQTALGTCHLHFAFPPTGQIDPNRLNQAMSLIGPAMRVRPNDPTILAAYGLVFHIAGQFDEAERAYRRALDIAPDDPTAVQYLQSLEQWKAGNRAPVI